MPLGYAIAGPIAEAAGLHATMIGASVISFALFLAAPAVEDVRAVPQESIASYASDSTSSVSCSSSVSSSCSL